MLDIKHNFGSFGRLFGVPRKFLSQVGSFCASLTSGHKILTVNVPAFPDPGVDPVKVGIDEDALTEWLKNQKVLFAKKTLTEALDNFKDAPTACTSTIDPPLGNSEWTACGANGIELDCYFHIQPQASNSNYSILQRCRLKFSKEGLLVSAKKIAEGVRIQAKNA